MSEEENSEHFQVENDTEPIIPEVIEPQSFFARKKWEILGGILALTSSLVYTFNGLFIQKFKLDFVDTLFVRSSIQTPLLLIFLLIRKKPLLLKFDENATNFTIAKKYFILVIQGILAGLLMMCSYLAVLYIPLGDAMTLIYAGPIFTMTFAFLFLRIRQGPWKIFFALVLVLGVILVVRPPFIFPNDNLCNDTNGNHTVKRVFYSEKNDFKKDNHFWIGVALALGAACIGGLINVSICYLKDVDNGTIMLWSGMMSILCSLTYLSFDSNSKIFFNHGSIDSTMVGQLFTLAAIGISGNWLATASYQLIDPTICAVLRAQEIVFAYVAQSLILHLIPCYISFIGAGLVVLSAVAMPLEKLVLCKNT